MSEPANVGRSPALYNRREHVEVRFAATRRVVVHGRGGSRREQTRANDGQ